MSSIRVVSLSLVLCLGLSACLKGTGGSGSAPASAQSGGAVTERDVEAPSVFSKRDKGLWDGRPSLGGVWVAHPDVKAPERVLIRNTETGRETIGALFKRERMNPGPAFQISAETADAIGILAGAPTGLEVVALRTEELQPAPAPTSPADTAQDAPAALAEAPAPQPAPPAPAPAPVAAASQPSGSASETGDAAETLIALPDAEKPRKSGFFSRLFKRGGTSTSSTITTAPLDATAPLATATDAPAFPAPPPVSTAPAAVTASALDRPFVQIGIFSVEANANGAARKMRNAGLPASVKPGSAKGNKFWRVVVGPSATTAEQRSVLAQVKKLGFADAYTVRR